VVREWEQRYDQKKARYESPKYPRKGARQVDPGPGLNVSSISRTRGEGKLIDSPAVGKSVKTLAQCLSIEGKIGFYRLSLQEKYRIQRWGLKISPAFNNLSGKGEGGTEEKEEGKNRVKTGVHRLKGRGQSEGKERLIKNTSTF